MAALEAKIILPDERRTSERKVVNEAALTFAKGSSNGIFCVVSDISDSGARITLKEKRSLPKRFKLFIPENHLLADCNRVWSKKNEVGLSFRSVTHLD